MNIVFMGTPEFSAVILKRLIELDYNISAVVTKEDKARRRGHKLMYTPVKELALEHNIKVLQPLKIKDEAFKKELEEINPDLIITAAYGKIFPKELLDLPKYGCVNVHASLLPKYRGAAPIQWTIMNGETKTGVTIMYMDVGIDTGDMLEKAEIDIDPSDTSDTLFEKLAHLGAEVLPGVIDKIERNEIKPVKQDESEATHTKMITKEMGEINWNDPAIKIHNQVRAINCYTSFNSDILKIWKTEVVNMEADNKKCGEIVAFEDKAPVVKTGEGCLKLLELQAPGKRRMEARDFVNGYTINTGDILV